MLSPYYGEGFLPSFVTPTIHLDTFPARTATMTRRRLLLFSVPVTFVVLGVGGWLLWTKTPISPVLTEDNAFRLRPDMSMSETEAILGPHSERLVWADGTVYLVWRNRMAHLNARFPRGDDTLESAMYRSDEAGRAIRVIPREHPLGRLRHQLNLP